LEHIDEGGIIDRSHNDRRKGEGVGKQDLVGLIDDQNAGLVA
jgi:hypothetical protein